MRTLGAFLAAIALVMASCGGGSDNGSTSGGRSAASGGQCPAGSSGQTCTGEQAYQDCVMAACGTQYKACFGNNFMTGDLTGGVCADWMTCTLKCPCDASKTACESNCTSKYLMDIATGTTTPCGTCTLTLAACVSAAACTMPVCTDAPNTTTSTQTTTSTSTGCAGAKTCCAALTATAGAAAAQQCTAALAGQPDAVCEQVVAVYRQAGICP
jgi:hypothetical protein